MAESEGMYIILVSMHGLVHGTHLELGCDPDTGGQVKYVVELARALIAHPDVEEVDLITRKIIDPRVSPDYGRMYEKMGDGVKIVRLPCGPNRYLRKEVLWPYMDSFADAIIDYLRQKGRMPDLIHGHYADAGSVSAKVSALIGIPMAFTGHSLGRVKEQHLLSQGMKPENIEKNYNIKRRIEGEETTLDNASFVVASTLQEVEEQYRIYSNYQPKRMLVIPPGVDLAKFRPPSRYRDMEKPKIVESINRFLSNPKKPIILALCRPDPKKNILSLVRAYGDNRKLRDTTNLVLVLGIREDIKKMEKTTRELFNEIFYLMDNYDLYGSLAVPKQHEPDDVPEIYRMAARAKGVFVNPAVTEPFGLTLIEAASSGLPVVATKHGGAKEIVEKCKNGLLVDPQNTAGIADTILDALSNKARWNRWARSGLVNAYRHYSWRGHVNKYIKVAKKVINQHEKKWGIGPTFKKRIITADRMLVCDIDNTLIGDKESLFRLINLLDEAGEGVSFGIATGRNLKLSLGGLKDWDIPVPNFLITSVGSEIFYGPRLVRDLGWEHHINYRWKRDVIREVIHGLPGIKPQGPKGQGDFKVSFFIDPAKAPKIPEISRMLRKAGIRAKVIFSHGQYLDIIPLHASKGLAVRHLAVKWGIPVERILVAGDSGNDEDMLMGNTLGVVVASHSSELDRLRGQPNIYFANASYAAGIIEAIEHYDFFGTMYPIGKEIGQNE